MNEFIVAEGIEPLEGVTMCAGAFLLMTTARFANLIGVALHSPR